MSKKLERAIEAAGWKSGEVGDFLGMTEEDRQLLEARVELARAIRRYRTERSITQKELAAMIDSTQPRVAKIESAASDVSFEQLFRAVVAVGGRIEIIARQPARNGKAVKARSHVRARSTPGST